MTDQPSPDNQDIDPTTDNPEKFAYHEGDIEWVIPPDKVPDANKAKVIREEAKRRGVKKPKRK